MTYHLPIRGVAGQQVMVACVDLGAGDALAGFRETYVATRTGSNTFVEQANSAYAYNHAGMRSDFVCDLAGGLNHGLVALGIEGPLWGRRERALGPYRPRPFEPQGYEWYGRNGGQASIKAVAILLDLLQGLQGLGAPIAAVTNGLPAPFGPVNLSGTLLLWEAYVTEAERQATALRWEDDRQGVAKVDAGPSRSWDGKNSDIRDALRAVRYGFCNVPRNGRFLRCALPNGHGVVPLAASAIRATNPGWLGNAWQQWDCMVVAPCSNAAANIRWS